MSVDAIPTPRDLANKPLVEAIFEIRWSLQKEGPLGTDPGFSLFQGRYYDKIHKTYPYTVALPAAELPEAMTPHLPRHQFRAGDNQWPVTQIGPGLLTVNETSNYKWNTFLPLLKEAVNALFDAYPTDVAKLSPTQCALRYINVVDYPTPPLLQFLKDKLHTEIVPEPLLFDDASKALHPYDLNLKLAYALSEPDAVAGVNIATGTANGKPSIIFEITVQSAKGKAPQSTDDFIGWVEGAHSIVDKWFFALIRGPLLEEFERSEG